MNRQQAKELLPIIQAFVEGKTIQYRHGDVDWVDVAPYSALSFSDDASKYRIKSKSKYRPFNDAEECWQEMQKHKPFGWVKTDDWYCAIKEIRPTCAFCHGCGDVFYYTDMVKQINFADGAPFGVKVG